MKYQSVNRSDEAHGFSEYSDPEYTQPAHATNEILSEKRSPPDFRPQPVIVDDDRTFWQKCNSYWVWETTACIISLACLGVIVAMLVHYDDQPRSSWPLSMEPAAFLSTFVTISRFTMLVGVAEGIAQLRWLYFLGASRRLDHLDTFDSASRGPFGSLLLLFKPSVQGVAPLIARFGALVMIVALAMDPFTQQIIKTESSVNEVPNSDGAWVLVTDTVPATTTSAGVLSNDDRRRSIYGGILGFNQTVPYQCTSSNCTWPDFSSLGYNIVCEDVANSVVKTCMPNSGVLGQNCTSIRHSLSEYNMTLTLQNGSLAIGPAANGSTVYTLLQSNTTDPSPGGAKDPTLFSFLIAQLLIRYDGGQFNTDDLRNPSWNLTACDVKYAGKIYSGISVVNSSLQNNPPRTVDLIPLANSSCWTQQPQSCQEFTYSNTSDVPRGSNPFYRIAVDRSPVNVRTFLDFNENITVTGNITSDSNSVDGGYTLAAGLFWNVNITTIFERTEAYLTDYLRSTSAPQRVKGTLQISVLYIKVRWGWFALPAALDLAGPIFLLSVIIYTWRGVNGEKLIWKTNTLPLLMHGLEGYNPHNYAGAETTGAIYRRAREMAVQLRRNENGEIRFVRT